MAVSPRVLFSGLLILMEFHLVIKGGVPMVFPPDFIFILNEKNKIREDHEEPGTLDVDGIPGFSFLSFT